jgi:micrococcal nuclease
MRISIVKPRILCLAIVLALAAGALPAFAEGPPRQVEGIVTYVSDGDTIHVVDDFGTKLKVRLYGIDAPETPKINGRTGVVSKPGQPYGEEAEKALKEKIQAQRVRLDIMGFDRYRRAIAVVWLGDRDINRELVAEGHAWAYRQYLDRPYAGGYIEAERQARSQKLGLWQQANPKPPWEFRRTLKRSLK